MIQRGVAFSADCWLPRRPSKGNRSRLLELSGRDRGASLLEFLVGLALAGLVLMLSYPSLRAILRLESMNRHAQVERLAERRIVGVLSDEVRQASLFDALPLISLLSPPELLSTYPWLHLATPPTPNSLILRFQIPEPSALFRGERDGSPTPYFVALSPDKEQKDSQSITRWAFYSAAGATSCTAQPSNSFHPITTSTSGNSALHSNSEPSFQLLAPTECSGTDPIAPVIGIVGLRDERLLYVDTRGVLRRVSVLSRSNQPLIEGIVAIGERRRTPIERGSVHILTVETKESEVQFPLLEVPFSYRALEIFS